MINNIISNRAVLAALFVLFSNLTFSQNISVDYMYKGENGMLESSLYINDDFSIYSRFYPKRNYVSEIGEKIKLDPEKNMYTIKNFEKRNLLYKDYVFKKGYFIADSLDVFNWDIKQDTLSVLGLKCQKAEVNFRGRHYIAYFSKNIKISDGPWKFNGLPGLILKIYSTDNIYSFEAIKIENKSFDEDLDVFIQKYRGEKIDISFADYSIEKTKKQEDYFKKQLSNMTADGGVITSTREIEIFFKYPSDEELEKYIREQ